MHLFQAASRAVTLALVSFPLQVHAQNLTVRFFQNSPDSCNYNESSRALTFTASSIPIDGVCLSLEKLFGGNTTRGFVNHTDLRIDPQSGDIGLHWQVENADMYDSQANYSSVLYRQYFANPPSDDLEPGNQAYRALTLYPHEDCMDVGPQGRGWYGFSCWSEDEGSCGTAPWNILSIGVQEKRSWDQCWVFALYGAAGRGYSSSQAMIGAFLSASLAIWLA
ncbi:hypothetical protein BDW02DRAFT_621389 [Decorospora gaudefroyi]|uniref:Uncharacterized protein n=1 Tax=Decorospora gaudefroyi TaxID=184978 RepID=A0A6A5KFN8_9PLEO|nr:hypothetical protein BDW02DRAFT_621389 [Decorospora gaudefroyi]